jgi:hypothetical protein
LSTALRCAAASEDRSEPLFATASHVPNWLLLEQPGGWGHNAALESRLDPDIGSALVAKTRAEGTRLILIRRGTRSAGAKPQAYFCHVGPTESFLTRIDIGAPQDLLSLDFRDAHSGGRGIGQRQDEPLHLVCTHGRHDACCSIRGNGVAKMLLKALPDSAWEASHIGGDRFAANILSLPSGVYYGRVEEDDAVRLIADLERGRLDLRHYRGRCCYPFPVQAAEFFLRRELELRGIDDAILKEAVRNDARTLWATFDVGGREVSVTVAIEADADAYLLTCKAGEMMHPPRFKLLSLSAPEAVSKRSE